jgi:hypothetical protein
MSRKRRPEPVVTRCYARDDQACAAALRALLSQPISPSNEKAPRAFGEVLRGTTARESIAKHGLKNYG